MIDVRLVLDDLRANGTEGVIVGLERVAFGIVELGEREWFAGVESLARGSAAVAAGMACETVGRAGLWVVG